MMIVTGHTTPLRKAERVIPLSELKKRIRKAENSKALLEIIVKSVSLRSIVKRTFDLIQNLNAPKFERALKEWEEKFLFPEERKAIKKIFSRIQKANISPAKQGSKIAKAVIKSMDMELIKTQGLVILKPAYTAAFVDGANGAYRLSGIQQGFDVLKPEAVSWIDTHGGADLVAEVTAEIKSSISQTVKAGIQQGLEMKQIASRLNRSIGLFARWRTAVSRLEDKLALQVFEDKISWKDLERKSKKYRDYLLKKRRIMIARTETAIAQSQGSLAGYKSIGVRKVRFYSAHGACEICAAMDGTVFTIEEAVGVIPIHPHGRCDWISLRPPGGFKDPSRWSPPKNLKTGTEKAISEIMSRYARDGQEHSISLDSAGNWLVVKDGVKGEVDFTMEELARMKGCANAIHNHPNSSSFSAVDLGFASQQEVKAMTVVSEKYRYTISPGEKGWSSPTMLHHFWNVQMNSVHPIYEKKVNDLWNALPLSKRTEKAWDELSSEVFQEQSHEIMKKLSEMFKFSYQRTKVSSKG